MSAVLKAFTGVKERTFAAADARGGEPIVGASVGLVLIEFQNEFATEGGKLHDSVKEVMQDTNVIANAIKVAQAVRDAGGKVLHCPITFKEDMSDNPNKGIGILKGCNEGGLFVSGTWNAEIIDALPQEPSDLYVLNKKGLDAFPGTNLEELLVKNNLTTVVLGGFLTNCCIESTMRTACEKGFNVITLKDCTACTSAEGQKAATEGTFGMFSTPMSTDKFIATLKL